MAMDKRKIGNQAEERAAAWLEAAGYQIIERNFSCRQGEIDLIAKKDDVLVFVEVKYRQSRRGGLPEEQVGYRKQERIKKTAVYYLWKRGIPEDSACRFDVIAVYGEEIRHIEDAFLF